MTMAIWTGSISPTGSALKTGGPDGGARVSFDIPEDGMAAYLELVLMRGKPLIISVCEADEPVPFDEPDDRKAQAEDARARMALVEDEIPF